MDILRTITIFLTLLVTTTSVYAGNFILRGPLPCPDQAILNMDGEFGLGTSSLTSCTQKRTGLPNVIGWNLASINKKSGVGQQVQVTRNIINNYENMYDMVNGEDFKMVAIGYSAGARWLITNEAYNRTFGVTTGNPTLALTTSLIERGVTVYMCQNTMRGSGWTTADLIPGVLMVPAGAVSILDHQKSGYNYINP